MKKVLIIGAGGIAQRHVRGFLQTGRAQLSIVEPDTSKRETTAATYPIANAYASIEQVELANYDLGVICAPAHVHIPLALRCANAGLPFLLEKPLAVTLDGCAELIETVDRQGIEARVGYIRRCGPDIITLRDQIRSGRIGRLRMALIHVAQEFPKYRPDFQTTYYARPEMGGGAILDAASHMIDLLIWIFGPVQQVTGFHDRLVLEGTQTEDSCLIGLRFADRSLAQIVINQFQKPNVASMDFAGTTGNLRLEGTKLMFANDDSGNWQSQDFGAGKTLMQMHEARFALQANKMLDLLDGKPSEMTTLREAMHNLQVALAAKQATAGTTIPGIG